MRSVWLFFALLPMALFVLLQNIAFVTPKIQENQFKAASTVRFAGDPTGVDPNEVHEQINRTRIASELPTLNPDANLAELAQARAQDMAQNGYYAHLSPQGSYYYDDFETYGITAGYSCENLDMLDDTRSQQVVDDWLQSRRGHRECVLDQRITHAGYATAVIEGADAEGNTTQTSIVVAVYAALFTR
jgi:uncharacterized protein YkwD